MTDALADLSAAGVAVWLDDLSRERLRTGNLAELVETRSVVGVTTNPSIFQKALSDGAAYDEQVRDLALRGTDVGEAVRALTTYDVRWACDVLAPVAERSGGVDGRVSIEVDPRISHDTDRTVAEAKALWWLVDRPNLYIKIPATLEGLPAITQVLGEGISVNVTLIFSLERYDAVMDAFLAGLELAKENGHDLSGLGSVASFFVSRVDTEIDKRLGSRGATATCAAWPRSPTPGWPTSTTRRSFSSDRWKALESAGAKPQRPLWASTGVKDPSYDDTRLRRRAGRAGHRQHHARGDAAGRLRPRQGPRRHGHRGVRRRAGRPGPAEGGGRRLRRRRPEAGGGGPVRSSRRPGTT